MTCSATRLEANRANSAHSTGPRTEQGKAASSRNATSHGLTAAFPLILPGEQPEFDALREGLFLSIQPEGALEDVFFSRLVHATWNLRRCDLIEVTCAAGAGDPLASTDPGTYHRAINLDLYRNRSERTLYRCTKELRLLQSERSTRELAAARNRPIHAAVVEMIPPMADIELVNERTQIPPEERSYMPGPSDRVVCDRIAQFRDRRAQEPSTALELVSEPNEATAPSVPHGAFRREAPKTRVGHCSTRDSSPAALAVPPRHWPWPSPASSPNDVTALEYRSLLLHRRLSGLTERR